MIYIILNVFICLSIAIFNMIDWEKLPFFKGWCLMLLTHWTIALVEIIVVQRLGLPILRWTLLLIYLLCLLILLKLSIEFLMFIWIRPEAWWNFRAVVVLWPFKCRNEVGSWATWFANTYISLTVREVISAVIVLNFIVSALHNVLFFWHGLFVQSFAVLMIRIPRSWHLALEAKKILMLLMIEAEFENFNAFLINSNYIYAPVLVYLCLQFKPRDKVCDHFEVHDSNEKIDHISCRIYVNLNLLMVFKVEERKEPKPNH